MKRVYKHQLREDRKRRYKRRGASSRSKVRGARKVKIHYPRSSRNPTGQPNEAQRQFHHVMKKKPLSLFSGGVGSGKTTCVLGFESAWLCWANPNCAGMLIAHDWNSLWNVVLPAFLRFLPPNALISHNKSESKLIIKGGRTVYYTTANNPDSVEGKNVSWLAGDEIRYWPYQTYKNAIARMRDARGHFCRGIFASTPAMGGWMQDEFVRGKQNRGIVFCSTQMNAHNLADGFMDMLKESYSERLYETYVLGKFKHVAGGVFEEFDPAKHLAPRSDLFVPGVPVHVAQDFGINHPAVIFFQHLPYCPVHGTTDCIHVLDELMPDQCSTRNIIPHIWGWFSEHDACEVGNVYCDPAGRNRSEQEGYTSIYLMEGAGFNCIFDTDPAVRHIPNGVSLINSKLTPYKGESTIYLASEMQDGSHRGLFRAFLNTVYPTTKDGRIKSDNPLKDGVFDHAMDAFRYGMVNTCPFPQAQIRTYGGSRKQESGWF
jgi:hypothetical protein